MMAVEKHHILLTLEQHNGNKSSAARDLGVSRKTLDRKLCQLGDNHMPQLQPQSPSSVSQACDHQPYGIGLTAHYVTSC